MDDTTANVAVLADHLQHHGFSVMVAQDGEEGIERAQFGQPDLILLDVMMPGMGGFETCQRLKAHEGTKDIPVIFMTALSDISDKITGYKMGCVDYVTKPFHTEEVLARINTHLTLQAMRRQLLEQNQQLQQEIAVRQTAEAVLAQRSQELTRSNAELEQMAYIASHDLQEPLRMVTGYLQLLEQRYGGRLDADAHEFIAYAVDGAKRMQALIYDLLTYSRLGTKAPPLQAVDCSAVMETVLRSLHMASEESGAQIQCGALPIVLGDAAQLSQLFQNLIVNAIKFRGNQPPCIEIRAEREDSYWRFEVQDNGIGIAPEYFERIFVMFQRLHSRSTCPGTGIGLAICKKIVERHGGRIWVEPAPRQGTTFLFTLPQIAGENHE
ncbi:MAG TPA: ATP-binding protein [Janthinobacterium sp.]|nr:ATP-binding protein [Janthinobacterium sp.]